VLGRVYEYFLSQFASAEGKKGGEFYTPRCVTASGNTAAPPSSVMKSRRFNRSNCIQSPPARAEAAIASKSMIAHQDAATGRLDSNHLTIGPKAMATMMNAKRCS
jgi:hypothetical protein